MTLRRSRQKGERRPRRVPDQVIRLAFIFAAGLVFFAMMRQRFIPESFGEIGFYRADAIAAVASRELKYAGWRVCLDCHTEQAEQKAASFHDSLSCEICHGPSYDHAAVDPFGFTPVVPKGRQACLYCHKYLPSRPTGFPQIIEFQHNPADRCVSCHDPHDPTPPEAPGECSACHRQIARTKAISHHSLLPCETCHEARPEHRTTPHLSRPNRPRTRDFCGQCHSEEVDTEGVVLGVDLSRHRVPHIDLADHGNTYQCWQCHYPHHP